MTVLVTGATGLVGNNVTRLLLERGQSVRVLVRAASDPRPLEGLTIDIRHGDVCDAESVRAACSGVSAVIHAAAIVHIGWTGLEQQRRVNVGGTQHVAEAALAEGAKMVHVSSVDALGVGSRDQPADEDSPRVGKTPCSYVISKREAEAALQEVIQRGLQATFVNPGFMLGPWDWKPSSGRMLLQVATRFTPAAPTGGMSVCDIRDVAAGICAALETGQVGRNYILAGENVSYLEAWRLFAEVAGSSRPRFRMGPVVRWLGGRSGDLLARIGGREPDVNSAAVAMSSLFHYYSSRRAESELGYRNRPWKETVTDAWEWFRANGYVT